MVSYVLDRGKISIMVEAVSNSWLTAYQWRPEC